VFAVALGKALAKPPVAVELCLPLVRQSGIAIVWTGEDADLEAAAAAAAQVGGVVESAESGLLLLRKAHSTPAGFPRRPGMAKKRPLA
jgi:16S rRNA (guanine527-N7)-methyltransferase